jgi:hypothetical protein
MRLFRIILAISTISMLASCQPKLTPAEADALKDVAPSAIDVTVQKIGGAGVSLTSAPIDLRPFAKLPAVFAKAYSPEAMNILAKTNANVQLGFKRNFAKHAPWQGSNHAVYPHRMRK